MAVVELSLVRVLPILVPLGGRLETSCSVWIQYELAYIASCTNPATKTQFGCSVSTTALMSTVPAKRFARRQVAWRVSPGAVSPEACLEDRRQSIDHACHFLRCVVVSETDPRHVLDAARCDESRRIEVVGVGSDL